MPSFSLQLTNPRHDTLVLHRVLPWKGSLVSEGPIVWLPVDALLHRDHRTQEPLIVHLPFDRQTGRVMIQRTDQGRETIALRFHHGPAVQHRPGGYPGTPGPTEETWSVAHLSLKETPDLRRMNRSMARTMRSSLVRRFLLRRAP